MFTCENVMRNDSKITWCEVNDMVVFILNITIVPVVSRCDFSDTAEYRISALNVKGETSAFSSVIVKSRLFICPHLS